jgi:hypothetical protein
MGVRIAGTVYSAIEESVSGRSLPALMYSREVGRLSTMTCTCPASKSVSG